MSKSVRRIKKEKKDNFKPMVYICAPLRGDIDSNINKAISYAAFAYQKGAIPVTPHVLFPFLDDTDQNQRADALFMDMIFLGKCQEVWVFGQLISEGMRQEIAVAKKHKQVIKYFDDEMKEVQVDENSVWE